MDPIIKCRVTCQFSPNGVRRLTVHVVKSGSIRGTNCDGGAYIKGAALIKRIPWKQVIQMSGQPYNMNYKLTAIIVTIGNCYKCSWNISHVSYSEKLNDERS